MLYIEINAIYLNIVNFKIFNICIIRCHTCHRDFFIFIYDASIVVIMFTLSA